MAQAELVSFPATPPSEKVLTQGAAKRLTSTLNSAL